MPNSPVGARDGHDFALERDLPVEIFLGLSGEIDWIRHRLFDLRIPIGMPIRGCRLTAVWQNCGGRHFGYAERPIKEV